MLGAIVGDVIGSVHEWGGTKTKDFPLLVPQATFTDDSVLTVAVAEWLLTGQELAETFHAYVHAFPGRGYGEMFGRWARSRSPVPYNSYGNGAAMRVSPIGFAFDTLVDVANWAERSAAVTHNHPEGIRGAQATAAAVFLARRGRTKEQIRDSLEAEYGYDLRPKLDDIRPTYRFNETCQGTVPQAFAAFFESTNYEDAIRNAISLGGDADTLAAITGGIAEASYGGVPADLAGQLTERLDERLIAIVDRFRGRFMAPAA
jgi:ADP-ribosylglycohydrolase